MRTIYISRHDPERARKSALEYFPDAEIIETETAGLLWIDNSVSTQEWLRKTGREHLVRPLEETQPHTCGFDEAWVGKCQNPTPCPKHDNQRCFQCGKKATKNCSIAGSLVCGMPECDEHSHSRCH